MEISSPNALSINLLYDKFWLPEGTSLFLYSKDKKQYMGGFTSINNKGDSINLKGFATGIIQGSNVVHGYKPIVAPAILTRSFRGSGNCQVNINCPEGEDWQKEKRAIALIVVNGFRYATGALLNTTANDKRPIFLKQIIVSEDGAIII